MIRWAIGIGIAVAHLRNDDHATQPHGIVSDHTQTLGMRVGTLPTSLVPDGQLY